MKRIFSRASLAALLSLPMVVFAQAAPVVPTTAVDLAKSVDLSDAKSAGLIIIAALVTLGVTLWGAGMVLKFFKPKGH